MEAAGLPGPGWRATALIILGGWVLARRGTQQAWEMSVEPWARHGCLMLARLAAGAHQWTAAAMLFGAATPQPPWGQAPRWWAPQDEVVSALGQKQFDALFATGADTPLPDVLDLSDGARLST